MEKKPNLMEALIVAKTQCYEFLKNPQIPRVPPRVFSPKLGVDRWEPPLTTKVKINTDGHFDPSSEKGLAGVICRNEEGILLTGEVMGLFTSLP